jgi:hypothetical protein
MYREKNILRGRHFLYVSAANAGRRNENRSARSVLRLILPVISISVMALHRQNAELDHDIATVLSEHACVPLDDEIEHLSSLLATCVCRARVREVAA